MMKTEGKKKKKGCILKKGRGVSLEFIIISAIALIVLIVIILLFTGGLGKLFNTEVGPCENVTKYNVSCLGDYAMSFCNRVNWFVTKTDIASFFCKDERELRQFIFLPEEIGNCTYEEESCF